MSNDETKARILEQHGCEILPSANGATVIAVQPRYQRGRPGDVATIAACKADLERAGISTADWLS